MRLPPLKGHSNFLKYLFFIPLEVEFLQPDCIHNLQEKKVAFVSFILATCVNDVVICTRFTPAQRQKSRCAKATQPTHLFVRLQSAQRARWPFLLSQHAPVRPLNLHNDYHYSVCQAESNLVDLPFVFGGGRAARKLQLFSTAGFSCRSGQIAAHLSISISTHSIIEWLIHHYGLNVLIKALYVKLLNQTRT